MGEVIDLNSRRPKAYMQLYCLFCHKEHAAVVVKDFNGFHPCPYCDEVAAKPVKEITK
jgi:hypothetical protein